MYIDGPRGVIWNLVVRVSCFNVFSTMMESTKRSYAPRFDVSHSSIGSIPSIDLTIMEEGDLPNDSVFSNRPPATVHIFSISTPPPSSNASRAYAPFVLFL